jgi:hypothetical protein
MSQAVPFVVFYALAAFIGFGVLAWNRPGAPPQEGARAAVEAALRGANLQAARVLPLLVGSLTLIGGLAAWATLGAGPLVLVNAFAPFLVAVTLGGMAWVLARIALEASCEQIEQEGAPGSLERLVRIVLGRTLVAHAFGALLGLLPSLLPINPALGPTVRGTAAFLLVFAASLSSNLEAIALRPGIPGRSFVSLAAATCVGFLRPVRTGLLVSTASLLIHSELATELASATAGERGTGIYFLLTQSAATVAFALGLSAVRKESVESKSLGLGRGALGAVILFGAGLWLAGGSGAGQVSIARLPLWSVAALLPIGFAVILPLAFRLPSRPLAFMQLSLVSATWIALGLMHKGLIQEGGADASGPAFSRHVLLAVSGGLLPLVLAWQSTFDSPFGSKYLGALVFETGPGPLATVPSEPHDGRTSVAALLIALMLGLGQPLTSGATEFEQLVPAVLGGAMLLALALSFHLEHLTRSELECQAALKEENQRRSTSAPAFSRALELGVRAARRTLLPPLSFLLLTLGVALVGRAAGVSASSASILGLWLGALCTAALTLTLTSAAPERGRVALGPLAFSLALAGAIALAIVPGIY